MNSIFEHLLLFNNFFKTVDRQPNMFSIEISHDMLSQLQV